MEIATKVIDRYRDEEWELGCTREWTDDVVCIYTWSRSMSN